MFAQRDLKDIPAPDAELERRSFQVADGFEVNLYAADPRIAKPIQMNFDAEGRLWIASSEIYPHIKPGEKANDKVLVVDDEDGDGVAEKTTVFADGLLIPTGVEPGDGGVYVANSTELLHFTDHDGDGKADAKRIVLSGFGTEDTHHILHTLRWGPEGLLYFNQSIYIHSHIETPHGVRRLNAGGIWQFRPETMELDVYMRGLVNSWGHHFDRWGQSFATDGAGGEGINYIVPGAYYFTAFGADRILHGLNPGSPKHCSLEIVSGRHLPDDWQGSFITNDFRGHRVCRFVLTESGSGYVSQQQEELIKTSHVAFRPIDVKMGPDGAIYIADWYNPIIQHGEVDFRDPRRDHVHGRIWRVTRKDRPVLPRPRLVGASTSELLEQLKSPEGWTRHHAKRVLKERGESVLDALPDWVSSLDPKDPSYERLRLEALWMFQALRAPNAPLVRRLLESPAARVRAAAVRVVGRWQHDLPDAVDLLEKRIADDFARVRLEAVRVLAAIRPDHPGLAAGRSRVEIALRALDAPVDEFLDYALWLTVRETQDEWISRFKAGQITFDGKIDRMTFALKAVGSPELISPLVDLIVSNQVAADQIGDLSRLVASLGRIPDVERLFELAINEAVPAEQQRELLDSVTSAVRSRKPGVMKNAAAVSGLLESRDDGIRAAALELAGLWKLTDIKPRVSASATDSAAGSFVRLAAIRSLREFGDAASRRLLESIAAGTDTSAIRSAAVAALLSLDVNRGVAVAVNVLKSMGEADEPRQVFARILESKQAPGVFARALTGQELPADVAKIGIQSISASGIARPKVVEALTRAGNLKTEPKMLTPAELESLVADVLDRGDAAAGERVFRRNDLLCMKCHAIGGAGGRVGPDLISLGASARADYIAESLVEPNKKIKENYHTVVVVTDEGKVVSGIKLRQSDTHLFLRDAEDREIRIPLDAIDEQTPGTSIMPAGLTEKLTRTELVNLVRFLSELGKVGGYSIGREPVARTWRVMLATKDAAFWLRRTSYDQATTDDTHFTWAPAYSTVSGELPIDALPNILVRNRSAAGNRGVSFARTNLSVATPGAATLVFNDVSGVTAWLDNKPLQVAGTSIPVDLESGDHQLTLSVDLSQRTVPIRVEFRTGEEKTQVRFTNGK